MKLAEYGCAAPRSACGAKKGRCAPQNAPWPAGNEISFFQRSSRFFLIVSFHETAATVAKNGRTGSFGCIWPCYLVDHHDGVDAADSEVRRFVAHPPQQPQSRRG